MILFPHAAFPPIFSRAGTLPRDFFIPLKNDKRFEIWGID